MIFPSLHLLLIVHIIFRFILKEEEEERKIFGFFFSKLISIIVIAFCGPLNELNLCDFFIICKFFFSSLKQQEICIYFVFKIIFFILSNEWQNQRKKAFLKTEKQIQFDGQYNGYMRPNIVAAIRFATTKVIRTFFDCAFFFAKESFLEIKINLFFFSLSKLIIHIDGLKIFFFLLMKHLWQLYWYLILSCSKFFSFFFFTSSNN